MSENILNYATIIQAIKFCSNEGAKIPSALLLSYDLMKNFLLGHSRAGIVFMIILEILNF
jgi:hypothetical protein